ncbi:MAG TPA: polyphenol oxidase family protein [Candidatus Saccharimonadales bacterium]|nr:polyphenol oxidase family protein [Candidatus Saccharimonadales bacterium]
MAVVAAGEITHIVEPYAEIAYSGKLLGNVDWSRFGDPAQAAENRQKLIDTLHPAKYVLQIVQMGTEFTDLGGLADEELAETYKTDGLFIDRPGVALGLNPADCNAVTMYDAEAGSILGLIHAGRQGIKGEIHLAALEKILAHGVKKPDVRVHMGPSVRQDSYYFDSIDPEQLADPAWKSFIERRGGKYHVDLVGRLIRDLADAGVEPAQMEVSPIDVAADPHYFSHVRSCRTGEQIGRNGVVAMLRTPEDTP